MTDAVLDAAPLGFQWPTLDPFLFCVHHLDAYPAGSSSLGPAATLEGRELGQDFEGKDGWRMYHGRTVPGFPQHPHRGFETVTIVRRGLIDHSDSLGAAARFGDGDVQWLTAGAGVVHSEMFPLLNRDGPNPAELFQIWLNLPAADKHAPPHFSMLWREALPVLEHRDANGRLTRVTTIAGRALGTTPPAPPPRSWASRPDADVALWTLALEAGARFTLPPAAGPDTVRTLYFFEGPSLRVGTRTTGGHLALVVRPDAPLELEAGGGACEVLMLQGRPISEPVVQYGPFVMNREAEIRQAFADYQRTHFGGWPWDVDDPVHGPVPRRFARHGDGREEERPLTRG